MSSGVQSQIGAKWKEDFVTTINSGFGNAGTPRSMNRKGVREGRERGVQGIPQHYGVGRTGKPPAPVPAAMLRSYALTFETEQQKAERQRKALAEEEQDLRRLIRRLDKRRAGLKEREENLDDEIDILVGDHGAEEHLVHDRCVTTARNSIRKFRDDLESFDDNMACERQAAEKFRPTYDGIFRTFERDIHRLRDSVRFMTQKVDRYNGIKQAQPNPASQKANEVADPAKVPMSPSPGGPTDYLESDGTETENEVALPPQTPALSEMLTVEGLATSSENPVADDMNSLKQRSDSVADQVRLLMADIENLVYSRRGSLNWSLYEKLRGQLSDLERQTAILQGVTKESACHEEALVRSCSTSINATALLLASLLTLLAKRREMEMKEEDNLEPPVMNFSMEIYPTRLIKNGSVEGEEASLMEKDDSQELNGPDQASCITSPPQTQSSEIPAMHTSETQSLSSELLIEKSLTFVAIQEGLMADVALLETLQGSWSQDENHQAMMLEVESVFLLKNSIKLQDDLDEAAREEEKKAGGELVTRLKQQSKMIYTMKGELSAMITSLFYAKHQQQKLKSERKVTL